MKKYIIAFAVLFVSSMAFAQEVKPKLEKKGDLVEATFYHDNGEIAQKGFYKDGKLHGTWKSYDVNGKKVALGSYENGKKVGKWLFWTEKTLKEVNYEDSRIASVSEWTTKTKLASNKP